MVSTIDGLSSTLVMTTSSVPPQSWVTPATHCTAPNASSNSAARSVDGSPGRSKRVFEQYAELIEEGCRDRSRARAVDDSEDERTSSDRYPGDEVLECDRLERDIEFCESDSGRRNHRYSAMILVEDVVGSRPRPNGTSTLQPLQIG